MGEVVCAWCRDPFRSADAWFAEWDTNCALPCCSLGHAEHVEGERERFQPSAFTGQTDFFGGVVG